MLIGRAALEVNNILEGEWKKEKMENKKKKSKRKGE